MSRFIGGMLLAIAVFAGATTAWAGPVVIDGTDANDHGSTSGGANLAGWLYMQKALENIAGQIAAGVTKVVVDLGTTSGQARAAIDSAFGLSTLPGLGWSLSHVDGDVAIDAWLASLSSANTGILYIPTSGLASGDLTLAEQNAINARGAEIASFVGGAGDPTQGGGLFAMGENLGTPYGWLTSIIPGVVVTNAGGGGIGTNITLTADGVAAFPGLTNADLSGADPWHNFFTGDLGSLKILGVAPDGQQVTRNVILGGGAGTVIQNNGGTIPEPASVLLFGLGGIGAGLVRRKRFMRV